jgi:hypothetical protein
MILPTEPDLITDSPQEVLSRVRELIEQNDVSTARHILAAAHKCGLRSQQLEHYQNVLAPPKTWSTGQASGGGMAKIAAWLRQYSPAYQGQWVALKDGALIGASVSRVRLQQALQDAEKHENTVFIRL